MDSGTGAPPQMLIALLIMAGVLLALVLLTTLRRL